MGKDNSKDTKLDPDWLRVQLEAVADWALDIAVKVARDDEDDLEAIENVRSFVHDHFAGNRAEIPLRDLLTTLGILISAIELEGELDAMSFVASRATFLDIPSRLPASVRCPSASAPVRRRRAPGRDITSIPLAA